jgi:predicted TIM-barrel enzyme
MGYDLEVEMIRIAHELDLFTTPYAFNVNEAKAMAEACADVVVAHMGLTTKGGIGARTARTLDESVVEVQAIADAVLQINPDAVVLCHGGPISMPDDAEYILKNTKNVHGFYGASSVERLPTEIAITAQMERFKAIRFN